MADDDQTAPADEAVLADLRGVRPPPIGEAKDAQDAMIDAEARGDLPMEPQA